MFDLLNSMVLATAYFTMGWRFYTRILPAMDLHIGRNERSVTIWVFATVLMLFAASWASRATAPAAMSPVYLLGHYALLLFSILYYRRMLRRTDGGARWANDGECP